MGENAVWGKWKLPIVALFVIIILSVIALTRKPVELDPNTPEGVVQAYLQAIADEEYTEAYGYLSTDIQSDCAPTDIAANVYYDTFNAVLGDITELGDSVTVEASIQFGATPLDPGTNGYYEQFFLMQQGSEWVITSDPWPYFTYGCRE